MSRCHDLEKLTGKLETYVFDAFLSFSIFLNPFMGLTISFTIFAGVKTETIGKGRILGGLKAIWRVFLEILPLQKSKEKRRKNDEKPRKT